MSPDFTGPDFTGNVLKAGVLGWPIDHSKSPRIHNYWLRAHAINGIYLPFAVPPDQFGSAVTGLQAAGFQGCNVTIPHKRAAYECADHLSPAAKAIGAVNTLTFEADGRIFGHNTDAEGFIENLRRNAPGLKFTGKTALVLGAGGAAQAVVFALLEAGVASVVIANRTLSRAQSLANGFARAEAVHQDAIAGALKTTAILVNTTSLGMSGQAPLEIDLTPLPDQALVTDIVYTPLETGLLAQANRRGNPTVDGLGMLLHQAVPGFEAWFGPRPTVDRDVRDLILRA